MKIVFDISTCNNPEENFYLRSLCRTDFVIADEKPDYKSCDVAMFMQSPQTDGSIKKALVINPNIRIGIVDPRGSKAFQYLAKSHFVVVNGVEKADFFSALQPNVFIYFDYPEVRKCVKKHLPKEKMIIGYHGNKVHLAAIFPNIAIALEQLAKRYNIEFWAVYNIKKFGKWRSGMPKNLPARHIQWNLDNYSKELAQVDIGIVPTMIPMAFPRFNKRICGYSKKYFLESPDDYLIRFKVPANACRVIPFALLGIPVVADMTPSISQFIKHGQNGFLAHSAGGWYSALEQLILSHEKRTEFSANLYQDIADIIDVDKQNARFVDFLNDIVRTNYTSLGRFHVPSVARCVKFRFNILWENLHADYSRLIRLLKKIGDGG